MDEIRRYQLGRWHQAVAADEAGEVIVLDGDPFKLYYTWAQLRLGEITADEWDDQLSRTRQLFAHGDHGLADIVLYADPGVEELARRRGADTSRTRRNFDRHTAMRPYFRQWYEAVASIDPGRVIWEHPADGVSDALLKRGRRPHRSGSDLFDRLLERLP